MLKSLRLVVFRRSLISFVILQSGLYQEIKFMVLVLESVVNWVSPEIKPNQLIFLKLLVG
jgi:hypothetical protein